MQNNYRRVEKIDNPAVEESRKSESNMKVYQKWEDMAMNLYVALKSYPKSERFTLAAKTTDALLKIGISMVRAKSVGNNKAEKIAAIKAADLALVELKVLVRLGMRLEFLSLKKYETLAGQFTEIGKMIGGWLKSASDNR